MRIKYSVITALILCITSSLVLAGSLAPGSYSDGMKATPGKDYTKTNLISYSNSEEKKTKPIVVPKAGYTNKNNYQNVIDRNDVNNSSTNKLSYSVENDADRTAKGSKQQELKKIIDRNAEVGNNYGIKYR